MLKRAWLSTVRKPSRTVILAAILFVMANLMLATIAIKAGVERSVEYAKETLGGVVYLQPDMEAMRAQMTPPSDAADGATDGAADGTAARPAGMTRPTVPVATAEEIAESEYVKDYTYSISATANANGFTPVETEEQEMRNAFGGGGAGGFGGMRGGSGEVLAAMQRGDMTVVGINSFAFVSEYEAGNMELAAGEVISEATDDRVMISADLADASGLAVGDTLKLDAVGEASGTVELVVIGIYEVTTDNFNANTLYLNPATAQKLLAADEELGVSSVKYYLTSAEVKEAFIAEAEAKYPTLAEDGLKLDIDTSAYDQMVGPIETVGGFATTILWVVIVAAVVIITLMVMINVKDRRYEMGVLMSLGARRSNILGQILAELVLVGTVAFALSVGTGGLIAGAMGEGLLAQQLAMDEQQTTQNFGRGQNAGRGGFGGASGGGFGGGAVTGGMFGSSATEVEAIDTIDVSAGVSDYAALFASGYAVLIVALILPSINILRYQPKTILTGKE
jgi:putative ABC transport system permease protein